MFIGVDVAKAVHVEQRHAAGPTVLHARQALAQALAIEQRGERVVRSLAHDARLAFTYALLHGIERAGELLELLGTFHLDVIAVVAALDLARGSDQPLCISMPER